MKPIALFSVQFTLSLAVYAVMAFFYVAPRLSRQPRQTALQPLVWVHSFRVVGGTILAPGAVGAGVPLIFQRMIGFGDMATALLALVAAIALRAGSRGAIPLVWAFLVVGLGDTVNAIIESLRYNVFVHSLGVNWVIVTIYVPALLVSSYLILLQLLRPDQPTTPLRTAPLAAIPGA
jgi:hypothetical protein